MLRLVSVLALVAAASAQFISSGVVPTCSTNNVLAGRSFFPHERYCNLYYQCSYGKPVERQCALGLFYDDTIQNCNYPSLGTSGMCSMWLANGNCTGQNFPDVCCDKYWTCQAGTNFRWISQTCPSGTNFDAATGQCSSNQFTPCVKDVFCRDNIVVTQDECRLSSIANNVCAFKTGGDVTMQCPDQTMWDQAQCACVNDPLGQCNKPTYNLNKEQDPQCRASFRAQFDGAQAAITAFSDKMGTSISNLVGISSLTNGGGFYTGIQNDVTLAGNEASITSQGFIYAYYFANNEILTPTGFQIVFKPSAFTTSSTIELMSNTFNVDDPAKDCPASVSVTVRNDGPTNSINNNDYRFTFSVNLVGDNNVVAAINDLTITVAQNSNNFQETGTSANYLRFTLAVGQQTVTAEAVELDSNTFNPNRVQRSATFISRALKQSKCGLTVGRTMTGRVREFNVYEGCANGFTSLIDQTNAAVVGRK